MKGNRDYQVTNKDKSIAINYVRRDGGVAEVYQIWFSCADRDYCVPEAACNAVLEENPGLLDMVNDDCRYHDTGEAARDELANEGMEKSKEDSL